MSNIHNNILYYSFVKPTSNKTVYLLMKSTTNLNLSILIGILSYNHLNPRSKFDFYVPKFSCFGITVNLTLKIDIQ